MQRDSYVKKERSSYFMIEKKKGKEQEEEPVGAGSPPGAKGRVYCLVLSSFSSSISFLEALTLLETSFP